MHRLGTRGLLAVALAGAGAAQAFAADKAPDPALPPAPVLNWTGFYAGGGVAADFAGARYKRPGTGLADTAIGSIDPKRSYSAFIGANFQVLPWAVIGVEGERTWLASATYRELGPSLDFLQSTNYIESVTGRAGVLVRPDTMVYGKVGPAWMNVGGFEGFGGTFSTILPSVQAGIGVETMVTPNVTLRAEGSYTRADEALSLNSGFDRYRPTIVMFQVGAAYKFDGPTGWGAQAAALPFLADASFRPSWTGVEIGGFASANGNQMRYFDFAIGETGPFTNLAFGGGAFVGVNYELPRRIVVGAEVSANVDHASFDNAFGSGGLLGTFNRFAEIDDVFAVTGRIGWLASPTTLLYVKGGPAWIRMSTESDYWNNIAPNATGTNMMPGYQIGFGAETFVMPHVSIRVEGIYTHVAGGINLNGTIGPAEFVLQPAVMAATTGVALHF